MKSMSFKIIVDSCCDLTGTMLKDPCSVKVPLTTGVETPWTGATCCGP